MSARDARPRGRPSSRIVRDGSARMEIAFWLAEWRKQHSGRPTQHEIAHGTGFSRGTVARRLSGSAFVEPEIVRYVLGATDTTEQERQEWAALYATLHRLHVEQERGNTSRAVPPSPSWAAADTRPDPAPEPAQQQPAQQQAAPEEPEPEEHEPAQAEDVTGPRLPARAVNDGRRPSTAVWMAIVVSLVAIAAVATLLAVNLPPVPNLTRPITVQNKVALGSDRLQEDKTPAYLSTVARPYCADEAQACKVPGSEMGSGALVNADCIVYTDVVMVNYNLRDPAAAGNPDAARSRLWYHGTRDGRSGYLSEVYVRASDRGGAELPLCGGS